MAGVWDRVHSSKLTSVILAVMLILSVEGVAKDT